jgi:hypothetical protein
MADELFALSIPRGPYDARFADGDDGDAGEPVTKLRRLAGGRTAGGAGDSQKKEPRPGEPEKDADPENAGDALLSEVRRGEGRGESTSISEPGAGEPGDVFTGSV